MEKEKKGFFNRKMKELGFRKWFSIRGDFDHRGDLAMAGDSVGCQDCTGLEQVEPWDALRHRILHRSFSSCSREFSSSKLAKW